MRRPSSTGGKTGRAGKAKGRSASPAKRRKAAGTRRRVAPATRVKRSVSAAGQDLNEARAQQAATAEILKVIASSRSDVQPVFQAIATSANRLLGGFSTAVFRFVDDVAHLAAFTPTTPAADDVLTASFPMTLADFEPFQMVKTGRAVQIADIERMPNQQVQQIARRRGFRSMLFVPLMSGSIPMGSISVTRTTTGSFAGHHVTLLQVFADQAVIAIENARLFNETQEALERQTATAEILKVIASSPSDVQPVFEAIAESAKRLSGGHSATVTRVIDDMVHLAAFTAGNEAGKRELHSSFPTPLSSSVLLHSRVARTGEPAFRTDIQTDPDVSQGVRDLARARGYRSIVVVPMRREGVSIGTIGVTRRDPGPFADKIVDLLHTFADQAVIAIENARLFNETRDALARQTATAEILKVIASSPSDVQPVFDVIVERAVQLCGARMGRVYRYDGNLIHLVGGHGLSVPARQGAQRPFPRPATDDTIVGRVMLSRRPTILADLNEDDTVPPLSRQMIEALGARSQVTMPMLLAGEPIGAITLSWAEPRGYNDHQIALLQTFADQAVIAIENARLFNETREALERQTATADILNVIASSPSDVQPVFEAIAERSNRLIDGLSTAVYVIVDDALHLMAFTRTSPEADAALQASFPRPLSEAVWGERIRGGELVEIPDAGAEWSEDPALRELMRLRGFRSLLLVPLLRDGSTIGIISVTRAEAGTFAARHVQLLQTFADQAVIAISNVQLFRQVQQRTRELSASLDELRAAQDRLIQTEKLASLGQLTAGIAHEIKNPLNFVNNFSALSAELIDELDEALVPAPFDPKLRADVGELTRTLKSNLEKVVQHGKRADSIVKNMLLHSREGSGEHRSADINALVEESLHLAWHGARAEKSDFSIALQRDLDPSTGMADVYPQEITRALLNFISNGFYAASKRRAEAGDGFEPVVSAATKNLGAEVEIRIRDNGTGIPKEARDKIFNPFFTTKPSGEGTGLGLSMCHDIIVKQHGGSIDVETEPGLFTEFRIVLPRENRKQSARR